MTYVNPIQKLTTEVTDTLNADAFLGVPFNHALLNISHTRVATVGGKRVYLKKVDLEEAFADLCAGVLACHIGVPVAPSVFHKLGSTSNYRTYSVAAFDLPLNVANASRLLSGNTRSQVPEDIENWRQAAENVTLPSSIDFDFYLLKGITHHASALLPFQAWIGEGDIGIHNCVVDGSQVLVPGATPDGHTTVLEPIRLYGVDCYINNDPYFNALNHFTRYFSSLATTANLKDKFKFVREIPEHEQRLACQYFDEVSEELLLPYADWTTAHEITNRILRCRDTDIAAQVAKVQQAMSVGLSKRESEKLNNLSIGARRMLAYRRDEMFEYLEDCPTRTSIPRLGSVNPFSIFTEDFQRKIEANRRCFSPYFMKAIGLGND